MNLDNFKIKFFSKINRNYGYINYPSKFKFNFELNKKIFSEKKYYKKRGRRYLIDLPSKKIKVDPISIWKIKHFIDREDFSALHRWTWAIKIMSEKKKFNNYQINFIETCIINWCLFYSSKKIDKKNIIFEPYNISERISNYIILIKLKIIKPNKFVLSTLENQYLYLLKNIELYKYKLSNHAMNNLRAIILFSNYINDYKILNYSSNFMFYLLNKYLDKDGFFKFGSSNYQFIFSKWLQDVLFFSNNLKNKSKKKLQNILKKINNALNFFKESNRDNISIPLFGNISPDLNNEWIINFFFKRQKNLFLKRYWKLFKSNYSITKIRSKEWFKIKKNNFSIYLRNPKIVGFDFNHSHNDFFNFVIFHKGKPLIIDLGRKNYSNDSLKSDLLNKNHNSIIINNKGIYDDYLFFNLDYKFGFKDEKSCNYNIKYIDNKTIKIFSKNKFFKVSRVIKIFKNKVILDDIVNLNKLSNVKFKFNLNTFKIKKLSNFIYYDLSNKLKVSFFSNLVNKIYFKKACSYYDYEKFKKCLSLITEFKKEKNIKLKTIFEV